MKRSTTALILSVLAVLALSFTAFADEFNPDSDPSSQTIEQVRAALGAEVPVKADLNLSAIMKSISNEFWRSLGNTFKYALIEVPFSVVFALLLAVFLNRKIAFRSGYRTIFFLPMVAAPAAVAMVWKFLYNQQFGLLNNVLHTDIAWISDPNIAWISIGVIGVWSIVGYNMILLISGLQEIPHDYYEAAEIDGATGVKQFFKITIPLLSPTIFFILQTRIIGALQQFDLIYMVMDNSNRALKSVETVVYYFYTQAFTYNNRGLGAAIVVCMLVLIMLITFLLQKAEKKWVFYN